MNFGGGGYGNGNYGNFGDILEQSSEGYINTSVGGGDETVIDRYGYKRNWGILIKIKNEMKIL